jgi:DNA mismatch repair protein MSH6
MQLKFASEIIPRAKYFAYNVNWDDKYLQLDSMALSNLEILENSSNYGVEGTLVSCLDHTVSPFGKRLLRKWLCHPLQRIDDINNRLDAVEFLMSNPQLRGAFCR